MSYDPKALPQFQSVKKCWILYSSAVYSMPLPTCTPTLLSLTTHERNPWFLQPRPLTFHPYFTRIYVFHASLDGQNPRLPSISAVSFSHAIILMLSTSTCWNSNKLLTHTDTQLPVQEVWHSHIPFSLSLHFCAPFGCNKKVSLHTFLLPVMLYTNKNTGCYLFVWLTDKARHQSIIPVSHTSTL